MPIQHTDSPKQPREVLRYSMTFTPGQAIATGDTLTGTPTITVTRVSDGVDVTGDYSGSASPSASPSASASPSPGPDAEETLVVPGSVERISNTVYVALEEGQDGETYKITFQCGTTDGETVEEDLVVSVREL